MRVGSRKRYVESDCPAPGTRPSRVKHRAILAALAILAGGALAGCGQRGPLYLPTVPPLPAKPAFLNGPASDAQGVTRTAPDASSDSSSDGSPDDGLALSPATELRTVPGNTPSGNTASPATAASSANAKTQ
jgi:predicted small lipoprotein YifL